MLKNLSMIIEINGYHPQARLVKQVSKKLEEGKIIIYPTDTVYGLGCDIFNKKAIQLIHKIKQQPINKPFSFICPNLTDLSQYARITNFTYKTLRRFLPGPYTFILEATRKVPKIMLSKRKTIGIRIPNHPLCLAIVKTLGHPILSTSTTDTSGHILQSIGEINEALGKYTDLIIVDGGIVPGIPSTVVSLIDDIPQVIREGAGLIDEFIN